MLNEQYLRKHWAETVKLLSGWFDDKERNQFITEIAQSDILLAAECRANVFIDQPELDKFLADEAFLCATEITKPERAANGLLALAVLEMYDKIVWVFKSNKNERSNSLFSSIIADFIRNGSEPQILTLLKILCTSNKHLLDKALDYILELSIVLTPESKEVGIEILSKLKRNKLNDLIRYKIICIFQLGNEIENPKEFLYKLIELKQIKYAFRLSKLTKITVDEDIIKLLITYLEAKESRHLVSSFISTLNNLDLTFNEEIINSTLAKSLNPTIKILALKSLKGDEISKELALSLFKENFEIGNKSSLEFADHLIEKYDLHKETNRDELVLKLLKSRRPQSIDFAYKLISKYSLYDKFNFRLVFDLLIGTSQLVSLASAKELVLKEFPIHEQKNLLFHLALITFKNYEPSKFTKQILLVDINGFSSSSEPKIKKEYFGFVAGLFNGFYQIYVGLEKVLLLSKDKFKFTCKTFFTFEFTEIKPVFYESKVIIISKNPLKTKYREIWFKDYYLGQVLKIRIKRVEQKFAIGYEENSINEFLLPISEISDDYVNDVRRFIKQGETYKIRVKGLDKRNNLIICSIKEMQLDSVTNFDGKLELLKKKYSKI